jgi:transposase
MSDSKNHKRPKYSLEFKQEAAKLVLEKGYTHQQAADHLGISLSALGRWVGAERKPAGSEAMTS